MRFTPLFFFFSSTRKKNKIKKSRSLICFLEIRKHRTLKNEIPKEINWTFVYNLPNYLSQSPLVAVPPSLLPEKLKEASGEDGTDINKQLEERFAQMEKDGRISANISVRSLQSGSSMWSEAKRRKS